MIKKFQAESSKVRNSLVEKSDKAVVFKIKKCKSKEDEEIIKFMEDKDLIY